MMRQLLLFSALALSIGAACPAAEWVERVPLKNGSGTCEVPAGQLLHFLQFGDHSYAPDEFSPSAAGAALAGAERQETVPIALFQGLSATAWRVPNAVSGQTVRVAKKRQRDDFWDQVLLVDRAVLGDLPRYELIESGKFGESLPKSLRERTTTPAEIEAQQASLVDPIIPQAVDRELAWSELEAVAYPLDFQKVLLASRNDPSPGFAYQNGQWLTTWLSHDLPKWTKEDHWFAPALQVGNKLVRPAPLSAETSFVTTDEGVTLPMWKLRWRFGETIVTQWMFSHRANGEESPAIYLRFRVQQAPSGTRLAIGMGRRPNCHYWDEKSRERTPAIFFTLAPGYRRDGRSIVDGAGKLILSSAQDFQFKAIGPVEMLATFEPDANGNVYLRTPQTDTSATKPAFNEQKYKTERDEFEAGWVKDLRTGAQVELPSAEWMRRIDIWQSQVAAITRVNYQGAERLSYGAYFYQAYFGPEEGWPIVALAQWGRGDEARRQAEIMLSAESRDKSNVHHQSRNGTSAWYTAEIVRLTQDAAWLESIAPALIENAEWTIAGCQSTRTSKSPLMRGLLPAHIYGGDVRDPATSLYASMVCYKGLVETADVFRKFGAPQLKSRADRYDAEAKALRQRLVEVMNAVVDEKAKPPFLPLALDIPSLDGKNEGPYERLTDSRLGNYWNLFAPSVLELGQTLDAKRRRPNDLLMETMSMHGGLWAGLPRFNKGLDAAYSIGVLREFQRRSMRDVRYRNQAIAGLDGFFLHAASRNGYTIPEVAGLFPYRLDRRAYEQLVRESTWNFGMYDADRYLDGHISFTEPLGAAAGEALWLIREALVSEGRDENGLPNGELYLLANAPSEWFVEGKEIVLEDFPTAYGTISLRTRSEISSTGKIIVNYQFEKLPNTMGRTLQLRMAPPGFAPRDEAFAGEGSGQLEFAFTK